MLVVVRSTMAPVVLDEAGVDRVGVLVLWHDAAG